MTHIRSTIGRKRFVKGVVTRTRSKRIVNKIYRAVERIISYKKKRTYR